MSNQQVIVNTKLMLDLLWDYEYNHDKKVIALLDHGADPNTLYDEDDGTTVLMCAVDRASPPFLEALLRYGADVHARDQNGATALLRLFSTCEDIYNSLSLCETVMDMLVASGASVHDRDNNGATALVWAARAFDGAELKLLLDRGASVTERNNDGETALHIAAGRTNFNRSGASAIAFLCQHDADTEAATNDGKTPLVKALESYHHPALTELLRCGASSRLPDTFRHYEIPLAAFLGDIERIERALREDSTRADFATSVSTGLLWAAITGQNAAIRLLIDHGADIHATVDDDSLYFSGDALSIAVDQAHTQTVALLLNHITSTEERIDTRHQDAASDNKPLRAAAEHYYYATVSQKDAYAEICWLLYRYTKRHVRRVLASSVTLSYLSTAIRAIYATGVPMSVADVASFCGATALRDLLKQGRSPMEWDVASRSLPLNQAVRYGVEAVGVLYALLEAGADINSDDDRNALRNDGYTPLIEAVLFASEGMVSALLESGADANRVTPEGKTAADLAAEKGFEREWLLLKDHGARQTSDY